MKLKPILPPLQIAAPSVEPVSIADTKAHLKVDISDDDNLITAMIVAARQRAETFTQRSFVTQTWQLYFDYNESAGVPARLWDRDADWDMIRLYYPPVAAVSAFEYLSAATTWTAVPSTAWHYDAGGMRIILDDVLPTPAINRSSFRVTYTAGYDGTGALCPMSIQLAIKTFVLHFYENREAFTSGAMTAMPAAGENLLMPYKIMAY